MKLAVFLNGLRLSRVHPVESKHFGPSPGIAMLLCFSKIALNISEKRLMVVKKL
jgi:hypothetical protein